jgi:hypothetical protein
VFQGTEPEPVPVEIVGVLKNANGPRQDIILGKMGGKAVRTNVAGGMSGSPVYIDGKLVGAVAFRISVFSPDAICGITPIELMLEINEFDASRPDNARTPGAARAQAAEIPVPGGLLAPSSLGAAGNGLPQPMPMLIPIETPLVLSGFTEKALAEFGPWFQQMGIAAVQGGAAATMRSSKPVAGWERALNPGETIAGALVTGDMSVSGLGTVTYNDGKEVLGFGHAFFNLGPVNIPMAKGEAGQRHRSGGRAPPGPAQRNSGRAGRAIAHDPGLGHRAVARRQGSRHQAEGPALRRVRPPEVDAVPDDADALQLRLGAERIRR